MTVSSPPSRPEPDGGETGSGSGRSPPLPPPSSTDNSNTTTTMNSQSQSTGENGSTTGNNSNQIPSVDASQPETGHGSETGTKPTTGNSSETGTESRGKIFILFKLFSVPRSFFKDVIARLVLCFILCFSYRCSYGNIICRE